MGYVHNQSSKVMYTHNSIESVVELDNDGYSMKPYMVFIPAVGPFMELNSLSNLFNTMLEVLDSYDKDEALKIYSDVGDKFDTARYNNDSLYLLGYNNSVENLINFFKSYVTDKEGNFDNAAEYEGKLQDSIKTLKTLVYLKISVTYLLLAGFITGVILYRDKNIDRNLGGF